MKAGCKVNVYDLLKSKYIAKAVSREDAAKLLGTKLENIALGINRGYRIDKRYVIQSADQIEPPVIKDHRITAEEIRLMQEWEEVREAARRIENGGKIVTRNGKKFVKGGKAVEQSNMQ